MVAASKSKFTKCLADSTGATFGTSSTALILIGDGLRLSQDHMRDEGMRGTRSRQIDRIVDGLKNVGGPLTANPTPVELDFWLPFILGGTKSGTSIPLAETLTAKAFAMLRATASGNQKWFQYDGCVAASAQIESSAGNKLQLTTNVIGKTETDQSGGSFPTPTAGFDTGTNYMHHNLVCTLGGSVSSGTLTGGTAYTPERVSVSIDNGVQPLFRNSQVATDVTAGDRVVMVTITLPYTSTEAALYAMTTVAGSLVYTIGGVSLSMVFPALKPMIATPLPPGGNGETLLEITYQAYRSGTENEIQVTNDSTP